MNSYKYYNKVLPILAKYSRGAFHFQVDAGIQLHQTTWSFILLMYRIVRTTNKYVRSRTNYGFAFHIPTPSFIIANTAVAIYNAHFIMWVNCRGPSMFLLITPCRCLTGLEGPTRIWENSQWASRQMSWEIYFWATHGLVVGREFPGKKFSAPSNPD